MGYYIRVLSPSEVVPDFHSLRAVVATHPTASLSLADGGEGDWTHLLLAHDDATAIASIERNLVAPGELGAEEIEEFLAAIDDCQPASAVEWLKEYLPTVKCIYAFQILYGTTTNDGWSAVHAMANAIQRIAGGIHQRTTKASPTRTAATSSGSSPIQRKASGEWPSDRTEAGRPIKWTWPIQSSSTPSCGARSRTAARHHSDAGRSSTPRPSLVGP